MATPDEDVSRDQKLIFIFAWNLVKSGDRFQAIWLQRFLNEAHVIDDDQVKAKGSPEEHSIELLSAVYRNCGKNSRIFDEFCRVVADKHQTILLDHMPGMKEGRTLTFRNIDDEELKNLYGTLKDQGDPFRPEYSKAIFSLYNRYVTSRNSYKELADVHRAKLEEHLVPSETVNFQVLWFTDTENQMKAVLAMLRKHKGLKGNLTLYSDADKRFSYYSIAIDDEKVFIHLVYCYCSHQERRSFFYLYALTYSKFNLDFAILTGRCLLFDKEGSDMMRGDVCIVEKAFDSESKDVISQIGVSADVSRVGDALRMKLEFRGEDPPSSGLLLHTSDATEMPRPVASCYAQMIWLTRLHLEILKVEKGKKDKKSFPSKWLQETGYDWEYKVIKRKKANNEKLRKFLPDWEKDGSYRGLLSYCKESGFWPKSEPNKTVLEKAEKMAINVETELVSDVREYPRLHVASFASKQEIAMAHENIVGMDSSTYEFYKVVDATRKQLPFASIKAVNGFVGCYSDKCPEPRLQPYCDRLAAVAALDLIERIRQE